MGQEFESLQARHFYFMVGIAQLVRALDCGSRGRRFDSDYPPHLYNFSKINFNLSTGKVVRLYILGCSQVGKAPDFDSGIS